MTKEHQAELVSIKCYCSKCGRIFPYKKREVEFEGWEQDHHGGSSMIFTCKGCKKLYSITLSEY